MAKSSRASVNKRNRTNLRQRVFGPADQARAERLSAKLQELAAQPKPQRDAEMELESLAAAATETTQKKPRPETDGGMDIDEDPASTKTTSKSYQKKKLPRVQKKRRGKAASTITFPKYAKGRKAAATKKGTR